MAQNDILNIDNVVLQPLEKCLLWLAYQSDKFTLEELLHKQMMKKMH